MKKRILSILLTCFMMITMFPAQTFVSMAETTSVGELYINMNFKITTGNMEFNVKLIPDDSKKNEIKKTITVSAGVESVSAFIQDISDGNYILEISAPKYVKYTQALEFDGRCIELDIYNNYSVNDGRNENEFFGVMPIGDVDSDGDIDDEDADKITDAIEKGTNDEQYDLNGDNVVDLVDLSIAVRDEGEIVAAKPVYKLSSKTITVTLAGSDSNIAQNTKITGDFSELLKSDNDETSSQDKVIRLMNNKSENLNGTIENAVEMTLNVSNNIPQGISPEDELKVTVADSLIISSPKSSKNTISEGEVEITYLNEQNQEETILARINEPEAKLSSAKTYLMDATIQSAKSVNVESDGTVVINLGKRVAIKKVTIRVTKTANASNLVEIAKVEFLSNFAERISEPQLSIPSITNVSNTQSDGQGFKDLTVEWNPEQNVTGYEVKVSGPGYNKTATTSECKYTFKGDSFNGTVKSFNTYNVYVRSVSGDWRSDWSPVKEYTVVCNNKPATPEYVNVFEGVEHLKVSWTCKYDAESYTVYYKKESENTYKKIEGIKDTTTSCNINGLESKVKYVVYVVAHNRIGSSGNSAIAAGTPTSAEGVSMPKYKLLNVDDNNNMAMTHISKISGNNDKGYIIYRSDGTNVSNGKATSEDWKALLDNNPSSYLYIDDWDSGVSYANYRGPNIQLDNRYKINTICIAPFEGCSVHINRVVIGYKDENNEIQRIDTGFYIRYDSQNKRYYEIVLNQPITTDYLEIRTTTGYSRNYTMSEVKLYYYDSLEDDVAALFSDNMRTTLKTGVTEEQINALIERANTLDSVSGEYHPHRTTILIDLEYALKLLDETANANLIDVDTNITATGNPSNGFAMALSDYQPLGHVAAAGDTVVVYVSDNTGRTARGNNVNLKLVATQFHPEVSNWQNNSIQLKAGRNEITIPKIGSYNKELGGSLYLQYTGAKGGAGYVVRICGTTKIPYLNVDGIIGKDRTVAITNYVNELGTYVGKLSESHNEHRYNEETNLNKNTDYDYSDAECFLNSTEIAMENMMYSVPAKAVWEALGSGDNDSKVINLEKSIEAMEQEVDYFYQFKGLNKAATDNDAYPFTRLNIRYHKMFTGAFMYAGGKHIGIEYGSVGGLFGLNKITTDEKGKKTGGNLTGWGISHEIGHCINAAAYQRVEVTNNMFAQLVATGNERNENGRWGSNYSAIYKAVATGTTGHSGNLAVQLAMYWQLHLAYDDNYIYENYGEDIAAQQSGLFYARLESYLRDKSKAPKAFTATGGDQLFMQAACAAADKDILDFFTAWGIVPDNDTKAYAAQYDKEIRKIQYIDDDSRLYRIENKSGMSSGTKVTASITNATASKINNNRVEISLSNNNTNSDAMLGYEIKRNGKTVAFVEANKTSYTDIVTTENNKAFVYSVVGIDRLLNETQVCTLPEVKICHDGAINKDGWSATTNAVSSKDTDVVKHTDDPDSGYVDGDTKPSVQKNSEISVAIDNNPDTVYYGAGSGSNRPYVILNLGGVEQVTALKFTPAKKTYDGDATSGSQPKAADLFKYRLFGYKIEVSLDGTNWTTVKQGDAYTGNARNESSWIPQDDILYNDDGSYTMYFCKDDDPSMYTYDAAFVKVTATNMSALAIAELDVLGPTNDNVDFFEVGYGTLQVDYNAGKFNNDEDCIIPKGSVIFSGDYKGDPSYNVVLLRGTYQKDENSAPETRILDGSQLFFAEVPEKGKLGQTSDGRWIFWLENKTKTDDENVSYNEFNQLTDLKSIQVELYRVQNALTLAGQRLTSTSLTINLTPEGINKSISITDKNSSNQDSGNTTGKLFVPTDDMVEVALNYSELDSVQTNECLSLNDKMPNLIAIGNTGAVLMEADNEEIPDSIDENEGRIKNYVKFSLNRDGSYGFSFEPQFGIAAKVVFESETNSKYDISTFDNGSTYVNVKINGNKKTLYVVARTGNLGGSSINGKVCNLEQYDVLNVNSLSLLDSSYKPVELNLASPVGSTEVASVKQAYIGGTMYDTFEEAIENSGSEDVIKLNMDVILAEKIDKEIIIDLNGKSMIAQFDMNKVRFVSDAYIVKENESFIEQVIEQHKGEKNISISQVLASLQSDEVMVSGIVYSDFAEAVNTVKDGGTIILMADAYGDIDADKSFNIVTNGYKWYGKYIGNDRLSVDGKACGIAKIEGKGTYGSLNEAICQTKSYSEIKLINDTSEVISIPSYKAITLDLNGQKFTGSITSYGLLTITDSSANNNYTETMIGKGRIVGNLSGNAGSIIIKAGIFDKNLDLSKMLAKGSTQYLIGDKWVVLPEGSNLQFELSYKICDENGTEVKSIEGDSKPDIVAGKEYTANIYLKTNSDNELAVRAFDFTSTYNSEKISVVHRANMENKYGKLLEDKNGKMRYVLATNSYKVSSLNDSPVAVFNFTVNSNTVVPGEVIAFDFLDGATVSTMNTKFSIPVSKLETAYARMISEGDGVKVLDYIYAPEGYALAIIAKKVGKNQSITCGDNQLFYTTSKAYISHSTNPYGNNIEGVYLAFVKVGTAIYDAEKVAEQLYRQVNIVDEATSKVINLSGKYTGDIDKNGKTEANDASLVYQMLKEGGKIWGYNTPNDNHTSLDALSRIISEGNQDGKLYGTIEDVNAILNIALGEDVF